MKKHLRITVEGQSYDVEVELLDEVAEEHKRPSTLRSSSRVSAPAVTAAKKAAPTATSSAEGDVTSPLSAIVVSIDVAVGDSVSEGQNIVTLEAMKMNTMVTANKAGVISAIQVKAGDAVEEGQSILTIQ
jgi:biotin carboxyl carrier protein